MFALLSSSLKSTGSDWIQSSQDLSFRKVAERRKANIVGHFTLQKLLCEETHFSAFSLIDSPALGKLAALYECIAGFCSDTIQTPDDLPSGLPTLGLYHLCQSRALLMRIGTYGPEHASPR